MKPRQAIGARKVVTGEIEANQGKANKLLKEELDRSMRQFKTKNPPFFGEYSNARMIIDLSLQGEPPTQPTPRVIKRREGRIIECSETVNLKSTP